VRVTGVPVVVTRMLAVTRGVIVRGSHSSMLPPDMPADGTQRMPAAAEPLVGRVDGLAMLDRALAPLGSAGAGELLASGEPGIGKTRFLAEVASRAAGRVSPLEPASRCASC
jgi:hypothetical protein